MLTKICSKCKLEKTISDFPKRKTSPDGFRNECKKCISEYASKYRELNSDILLKKQRDAHFKNREKRLNSQKEWRNNNKDRESKRNKQWRVENKDYIPVYNKKYYEENKENLLRLNSIYRKSLEGKAALARSAHKRRINGKNVENTLTADGWTRILLSQGYRCNGCKREFNNVLKPHRDHILPIIMGGGLTEDNVQALCKSCNSKKKSKVDKSNIRSWFK